MKTKFVKIYESICLVCSIVALALFAIWYIPYELFGGSVSGSFYEFAETCDSLSKLLCVILSCASIVVLISLLPVSFFNKHSYLWTLKPWFISIVFPFVVYSFICVIRGEWNDSISGFVVGVISGVVASIIILVMNRNNDLSERVARKWIPELVEQNKEDSTVNTNSNKTMDEKKKEMGVEDNSYKQKFCWAIVFCAVVLLFMVWSLETYGQDLKKGVKIFFEIIMALSSSGLAGLLVAILVDTPQIISNFKKTLTDALASNDYLKELPNDKLEVLRRKIVGLMHKDRSRVPVSFLQLDDDLCGLIDAPYYEYMYENIVCSAKTDFYPLLENGELADKPLLGLDGKFFKKDVQLEFQIKNPDMGRSVVAIIGMNKYMDLPNNCDLEMAFLLKSFEVSIDNGDSFDIKNAIIVERCPVQPGKNVSDPNTMTYDTIVRMRLPQDSPLQGSMIAALKKEKTEYKKEEFDTKSNISVLISDNVRVKISYSQICPVVDSHYTRRLTYSAKNYELSYTCQDDFKLHGQVFGTLIKQSDMSIIKNNANNLTLTCRSWLLPQNGAFIGMDDVAK